MLRLFDSASGRVRELARRDAGAVSLYVCGPTVYGHPHLGHGRSALTYDILRRYLEWSGLAVRHVSNVTDIDDKIIRRAQQEGHSPSEVAAHYETEWYRAMDALGVLRPTADPHATAYVEEMVGLVGVLVDKGVAYETTDGVYLSVEAVDGYGLLAGQPLESLRAGERVEVLDEKRSPLDFVLWKKAKAGEPSWWSPWGAGRPGWHTECVVMSLDLLGDGFDLHAGGSDLRFPHHENERAQAVALGRDFAGHWMHHAFVVDEAGEKMSKSLGNVTNLPELVARYDPRAYRLLVLQSHYRSPMTVNAITLERAVATLAGLDALARRAADAGLGVLPGTDGGGAGQEPGGHGDSSAGGPTGATTAPVADPARIEAFAAAMDEDLDTPNALALLFDSVKEANRLLDAQDLTGARAVVGAVIEGLGAVGLELRARAGEVPADVAAMVEARNTARAAKDWAASDRIRSELQVLGWIVEDSAVGTKVRPR